MTTCAIRLPGIVLLTGIMLSACQNEPSIPASSGPFRAEAGGIAVSQQDLKAQQPQLIMDSMNDLDATLDPLFIRYFDDLSKAWTVGHITDSEIYTNLHSKGQDILVAIAIHNTASADQLLSSLLIDLQAAVESQIQEPDAGVLIGDVQAIMRVLDEQIAGTLMPEATATMSAETTGMPPGTPAVADAAATVTPIVATPTPTDLPTTPTVKTCMGTPMIPQLTVWSEPSLQSTRLGFINPGERYPVYSYVNTGSDTQYQTRFYKIGYQGTLAWTPSIYLQLSGDCSAAATPSVPTGIPPTVPPEMHSETWTLVSAYVSSDACSGAATVDVAVPVTLGFDESGTLKVLAWYSRAWMMRKAPTADGLTYSGKVVVAHTENQSIVDTISLVFTSSQTFEGDMTRTVTSGQNVCKAYYRWHGSH
jgi:hypothetical protein